MTGNVGWGPSYEVVREPTTGQRRRAALAAAAHAVDATELSELLAMLGLSATDAHPDSGAIDGRAPHRSGTSPEVLAELARSLPWYRRKQIDGAAIKVRGMDGPESNHASAERAE